MTALLERTEKTLAKTWTALEVLQGWYRHYLSFDEGKDRPVQFPRMKAPSYHKRDHESRDFDREAWARVEEIAGYDSQVPYRLVRQIERGETVSESSFMLALMADLAGCPFPLDAPEREPVPDGWELRGGVWVPTEAFLAENVKIGNVWVRRSPEMREGLKKRLSTTGRAIAARQYRGRKDK